MQKIIFIFIAVIIFPFFTHASGIDTLFFRQQERMLLSIHNKILTAESSKKAQLELNFRDSLAKVFQHPDANYFTFDSLIFIGKINSSDNKLIIYTWNIPQPGGFHNYYGLVQYYIKKDKKYKTTILEEKIGFLSHNPQAPALANAWPGVLYYKIITNKTKEQTYYTLLGFDFNNLVSNRKTIETITFDKIGNLFFQSKAFIYEGKSINRVVFEYAERVQMVLEYNEKKKIIYFDHLSPFRPSLDKQYQFYGPDLSYDGLIFEKGIWIHKTDIRPIF